MKSRPVAALSLCVLLSSLGISVANVALPTLAQHFDAPISLVQRVVLAYLLATTTMVVSVGRLADLGGRRRILLAGAGLFIAASAACGIAPSLPLLVAARTAQGLGAAAMMALALPFVAEVVPKEKIGRAIGTLGTMSAAGTALGPSLGGILIGTFGWRAVFLAPIPLAFIALVLAARSLPAPSGARPERQRFDTAGTLLLAFTLAAYAVALTAGPRSLLLAALAGLAMLVRVETRAASPLLRLDLLSDRARTAAFATNALVTTVVMASLVVGPFYLADALGLDASRVGLVLSTGPLVAALSGLPAGAVVDRFGARGTALAGLAAAATGSAMLSMIAPRFGVAGWIAPLILVTAGYALFQAANNTSVMGGVEPGDRGVISGMLNLSRNLGLITGASVMGAVYAAGGSPASAMRTTFGLATGLVVVALAIAWIAATGPRTAGRVEPAASSGTAAMAGVSR